MRALLLLCVLLQVSIAFAATRTYFIAADEIEWNYLPLGNDPMRNQTLNDTNINFVPTSTNTTGAHTHSVPHSPETYATSTNYTVGRRYKKAIYRAYTDASFTTLATIAPAWSHLGILGPVIRAAVGDTIQVFFKNQATRPYSMHPHGVAYTRANAGVPLFGSIGDDGNLVLPGSSYTYVWEVPERAGPGPSDPSSLLWMYHSHVNEVADTNSGLIGPLIITRKGSARSADDPTPVDVSREIIIGFSIYDENESPYLNDSVRDYLLNVPQTDADWKTLLNDATFIEGNLKHTVNGYLYSNVPDLNMTAGERVRWYVFGLGSETDVHGVHWHGQTLLHSGRRVDVMEIIPASLKTLDMVPDNPGQWMLHCHTNHHIHAGMMSLFNVASCTGGGCTPPPTVASAAAQFSAPAVLLLASVLLLLLTQFA